MVIDMSKKIAFLINDLSHAGGTERVTTVIANELHKIGYHIVIYILNPSETSFFELNDKIKIKSINKNGTSGVKKLLTGVFRLWNEVRNDDIDILISVDSTLSLYALPATITRKKRTKNICWEHFNFMSNLDKKSRDIGRKISALYSDKVVVLTDQDKGFWENSFGTTRGNIIRIHNPSAFSLEDVYSPDSRTILCVGRLVEQKGFDLILKAWKLLPRDLDWELVIVGDGPQKVFLETYISENNLDNVRLVPSTLNIKEYYNKAGVFCLPSRFEGYVLVLVEALTFALPSIAFDCETGPAEIMQNDSGILVPKENVEIFADKISMLINDSELRGKYSERAFMQAKNFSITSISRQWVDLIENTL